MKEDLMRRGFMKPQELEKVIDKIYQMDDGELSDVIGAVMARFGQVQPEKELFMLAVPKNDPEEQKRIVEFAVQMIDRGCRGGS